MHIAIGAFPTRIPSTQYVSVSVSSEMGVNSKVNMIDMPKNKGRERRLSLLSAKRSRSIISDVRTSFVVFFIFLLPSLRVKFKDHLISCVFAE